MLYTDAQALAGRGLLNGEHLGDFKAKEKVAPSLYGGRIVKRKGDAPPVTEPPAGPVTGTSAGPAHPVPTTGGTTTVTPPFANAGTGPTGIQSFLDKN